jgi:hypothetical protein
VNFRFDWLVRRPLACKKSIRIYLKQNKFAKKSRGITFYFKPSRVLPSLHTKCAPSLVQHTRPENQRKTLELNKSF